LDGKKKNLIKKNPLPPPPQRGSYQKIANLSSKAKEWCPNSSWAFGKSLSLGLMARLV
jgi:hypothetical protein